MNKLRAVSYKEHGTWNQGWCLMINADMQNTVIMVVERHDGTIVKIPIEKTQFNTSIMRNKKGE